MKKYLALRPIVQMPAEDIGTKPLIEFLWRALSKLLWCSQKFLRENYNGQTLTDVWNRYISFNSYSFAILRYACGNCKITQKKES